MSTAWWNILQKPCRTCTNIKKVMTVDTFNSLYENSFDTMLSINVFFSLKMLSFSKWLSSNYLPCFLLFFKYGWVIIRSNSSSILYASSFYVLWLFPREHLWLLWYFKIIWLNLRWLNNYLPLCLTKVNTINIKIYNIYLIYIVKKSIRNIPF